MQPCLSELAACRARPDDILLPGDARASHLPECQLCVRLCAHARQCHHPRHGGEIPCWAIAIKLSQHGCPAHWTGSGPKAISELLLWGVPLIRYLCAVWVTCRLWANAFLLLSCRMPCCARWLIAMECCVRPLSDMQAVAIPGNYVFDTVTIVSPILSSSPQTQADGHALKWDGTLYQRPLVV